VQKVFELTYSTSVTDGQTDGRQP